MELLPHNRPVQSAPHCGLVLLLLAGILTVSACFATAAETIWLEAEHLDGISGYCWPMGRPNMKQTKGHWGLSGPGWAAEWNQGGESGFLSVATGPNDAAATASKTLEIPVDGRYSVWVRYGDWREKTERFQIQIEQAGTTALNARFGERAKVDEDNEMKLYFGWAFAWDGRPADLKRGPATLKLVSTTKDSEARQVDVIVLTTDAEYQPRIKDRPRHAARSLLESWRQRIPEVEPLAAHRFAPAAATAGKRARPTHDDAASWKAAAAPPAAWKLRRREDGEFLYLWNVDQKTAAATWLSSAPDRVKVPFNLRDQETLDEFKKKYADRDDVPIFSDPRIVPTFHGAGPGIFAVDAKTADVNETGKLFAAWLKANPERPWAMMMNYHPDKPLGDAGLELFQRYRDRYVGSISGESLGYFYPPADAMKQATAAAKTRRQLVEAFVPQTLAANSAKYHKIYGRDLDANPYQDVIPCLSVGNIAFAPLCFDWGARTVGYESASHTSSLLGMRWAFMRGGARQHSALTATYRSCNFGDSATMFSKASSYTTPQNIYDNYYSVYSGAGMTWYKFDIWYQFMAGSSMFYHEQGFDELWRPSGTTAAGVKEVQLSPKGKLVDRFLRTTAKDFDRGNPYTPVAFLVDYAHGWEPSPYWPNSFKNWHQQPERFRYGDHEAMLEEYLWLAYHPIGSESEKPINGINEVNVAGVFGDIFDCIFAYPDTAKWRTIDSYPVVIAIGDIELTASEGQRLVDYVNRGGTLLVADEHLSGPGAGLLDLPSGAKAVEAQAYHWLGEEQEHPSPRFRFRPIPAAAGRPLGTTPDGKVFCSAIDRGQGRIVYLSVPRGLSITRRAVPAVARLMAHLTRGLMPIEVQGDVQWMLNRNKTGWVVTLLNPAGQIKPQQGITPTDYRENRQVVIRTHIPLQSARDVLLPDDPLKLVDGKVDVTVQAGAVRLVELR